MKECDPRIDTHSVWHFHIPVYFLGGRLTRFHLSIEIARSCDWLTDRWVSHHNAHHQVGCVYSDLLRPWNRYVIRYQHSSLFPATA